MRFRQLRERIDGMDAAALEMLIERHPGARPAAQRPPRPLRGAALAATDILMGAGRPMSAAEMAEAVAAAAPKAARARMAAALRGAVAREIGRGTGRFERAGAGRYAMAYWREERT
jgi:hypothetical protein